MTGQMVLQSTALAASDDDLALTKLLEDLAREHARLIYRIAYCVLRNHHDAEDVTQEVFLQAMRHKHKLSGLQEPKAWLARIAWRAAVARAGSRIRRAEFDLESIARQLRSGGRRGDRLFRPRAAGVWGTDTGIAGANTSVTPKKVPGSTNAERHRGPKLARNRANIGNS